MSDATNTEKATAPEGAAEPTATTNQSPEGTGQETNTGDDKSLKSALAQKEHFREKAEAAQAELNAIKESKLKENEEWKTLAETKEAELSEWKAKATETQAQMQKQVVNNALIQELSKHNPVSLEDAIKLADTSSVSVDEDGNVVGVSEAVSSLVENKTFLFGEAKKTINADAGTTAAATDVADKRVWTRAELSALATNPEEYAKHRDDINLARREGRIKE